MKTAFYQVLVDRGITLPVVEEIDGVAVINVKHVAVLEEVECPESDTDTLHKDDLDKGFLIKLEE